MRSEREVRRLLKQATDLALEIVERRARAVLRRNTQLKEFVMGMGTAMFTTHDSRIVSLGERQYTLPVERVLDAFDEELKLTGVPVRFTVSGPVVTDW